MGDLERWDLGQVARVCRGTWLHARVRQVRENLSNTRGSWYWILKSIREVMKHVTGLGGT